MRPAGVATRSALATLLLLGAGCDVFSRWDALVYTNKFDRANSIDIGTYGSLEECRAAALEKIRELKIGELGSYVCGKNCMVKWGFGNMRMCERTSR
ncbi:MAG: hypothetical protein ACU85V_06335 [Gammaproteobacteria bacterium]